MAIKRTGKGGAFLRYFIPIVEALKAAGNSGAAGEITDRVIERMKISESEQAETTSSGQSKVRNQIAWARFYFSKAQLLDSSPFGVWTLTEAGERAKLDEAAVLALFQTSMELAFSRSTRWSRSRCCFSANGTATVAL